MAATGFLDQRPGASPLGIGTVLLLHAGVIGAVLLIKGPTWVQPFIPNTITYDVPPVDAPDPEPRPRPEDQREPIARAPISAPEREVIAPAPNSDTVAPQPPSDRFADAGPITERGTGTDVAPPARPPEPRPAPPVRIESQFESRSQLQPPYPASEIRRGGEGSVQIRVTIGANGRVLSATRLTASSDAFWEATQRWAMNRWRFRPATLDGRPVESTKVLTVHFRLDGQQ